MSAACLFLRGLWGVRVWGFRIYRVSGRSGCRCRISGCEVYGRELLQTGFEALRALGLYGLRAWSFGLASPRESVHNFIKGFQGFRVLGFSFEGGAP